MVDKATSSDGIGGFFKSILGGLVGGGGGGESVTPLPDFVPSGYANGGIMTALGDMNLKKYANGGIANSPQLAVFGEGRMNEAYVPLPDGRSIPVTMSSDGKGGKGSGETNISIQINNEGASNTTSNGGADDGGNWRMFAEKVTSMIKQQLIEQKRPGGLLSS